MAMTCEEAAELITGLVDHELSGIERSQVEEHLGACQACQLAYRREREVKSLVQTGLSAIVAPSSLEARLQEAYGMREAMRPPGWRRYPRSLAWVLQPAVVLAVLILLLIPFSYFRWPPSTSMALMALDTHERILAGTVPYKEEHSAAEIRSFLFRGVGGRFAPAGYDLANFGLRPEGGFVDQFGRRKVLVTLYKGTAPDLSCYTFLGDAGDLPAGAVVYGNAGEGKRYFAFTNGTVNAVMQQLGERLCILVSKMPMEEIMVIARSMNGRVRS